MSQHSRQRRCRANRLNRSSIVSPCAHLAVFISPFRTPPDTGAQTAPRSIPRPPPTPPASPIRAAHPRPQTPPARWSPAETARAAPASHSRSFPSCRKIRPASTNPLSSRKMLAGSHSTPGCAPINTNNEDAGTQYSPFGPRRRNASSRSSPSASITWVCGLHHNIGCAIDLID